jgi:hypothetical protein
MSRLQRRSRPVSFVGMAIVILGVIFVIFALAPVLVPGGVPTGPLEFGGKGIQDINALELLLGVIIMIVGGLIWKFAPRRIVFLAAGVICAFLLSAVAFLSSLNSNLILTSIDVTFQYGTNDQGYFGPTQQMLPIIGYDNQSNQNLTIDELSSFNVTFSLRETSQASGSDGITSIKATTAIPGFAFQIASVSPSMPVTFSPGKSILFKLRLIAPGYSSDQSCPPQYCYHGWYKGPLFLVLTTANG